MLQKVKHIIAPVLVALFLYPIVFQSIHVFEHNQEQTCCSHCHAHEHAQEKPKDDKPVAQTNFSETEDHCPVCDFHFAKLQIDTSTGAYTKSESHTIRYAGLGKTPYIHFQGFIFSLRAPPKA
jgi:CRISPR/Cas system-associated protein Cas10 (large subunit of type III CRISPR-Cas system)